MIGLQSLCRRFYFFLGKVVPPELLLWLLFGMPDVFAYSKTNFFKSLFWPFCQGRMADGEFLDPLDKGGKPSNIPGGICWLNLVVLVEHINPGQGRVAVEFLDPLP